MKAQPTTKPEDQESGAFFEDLEEHLKPTCVKMCTGISCLLNGARRERENLKRVGHDCEAVSCLGHCDRSPVFMDELTLQLADLPTHIRCHAPRPVVTKRILTTNAAKLDVALENGVYASIPVAFSHSPDDLIDLVTASGIRGRGGAGIPTGEKWKVTASKPSGKKYVIANGNESEPGSFIDRVLFEEDPHTIIEGMILCGYAIGADEGIIHIRSEYPFAAGIMNRAILDARKAGYLGTNIFGSGINFEIRIFVGVGSYRYVKEPEFIQSIDGGDRPDGSTDPGLYGKPTVINNVETFANIPFIVTNGEGVFQAMGTHASSGTKVTCLNAGFANPGIAEIEYGTTLREIIEEIGGGGRNGKEIVAVFIGGPMGSIVLPKDWDLPLCFDVLKRNSIRMGHGGFVAIPGNMNLRALLDYLNEFAVDESCRELIQGPVDTLNREFGDRLTETTTGGQRRSPKGAST